MRLSNFTFQVCPWQPVCGGPLPNHHQPKVWRGGVYNPGCPTDKSMAAIIKQ